MWRMTLSTVLGLMVLGCSQPAAETTTAEKDSAAPAAKAPPAVACASPEQLVNAFKQAQASKDIKAIEALRYWEGVDADWRELALELDGNVLKGTFEKVSFEKCPPDKSWEFSWKGIEFTMNLKPIGSLKATLPPDWQGGKSSVAFPVGVKDGRYYLVGAVRVQDHKTKQTAKTRSEASAVSSDAIGSIVGIAVDARGNGVEDVTMTVCRKKAPAEAIASATTEAGGKFTVEKVPVGDDLVVRSREKEPTRRLWPTAACCRTGRQGDQCRQYRVEGPGGF